MITKYQNSKLNKDIHLKDLGSSKLDDSKIWQILKWGASNTVDWFALHISLGNFLSLLVFLL